MAPLPDGLSICAGEHFDDVIHSKAEPALPVNSMNAGEKFLCRDGSIDGFAWLQTIIATIAGLLRKLFAEVFEQRRTPAFARLGIMHHLPELLSRDPRFALTLFINEMQLLGNIARAEKQHAFAGQPVAPGTSRLLIIALQILWQIVMHDETHIRFVDTHAERNRRTHHSRLIA